MPVLNESASSLVEGWLSSFLCGINVVLYLFCLRVLLKSSPNLSPRARWLLALSSSMQMMICFASSAILLAINRYAFATLGGGQRGEMYLLVPDTAMSVAEEVLYTANDWIGSGILLWRAYMITNRNRKLIAPLVLLWVGLLVALIGSLYQLTHLPSGSKAFDPRLAKWVFAFIMISLVLQLGATALIAWRIWETINRREHRSWANEWHALRVVVESGAIYGVVTVLLLVFYLTRANVGSFQVGVMVQVSATCPFLIILRAYTYREEEAKKFRMKLDKDLWKTSKASSFTGMSPGPSSMHAMPSPSSARTQFTVEVQVPPAVQAVQDTKGWGHTGFVQDM
ncbi:hypothetical protein PENSPDRAFT_649930 [Peniophora sp. CONT]|nr:hypothetical protein PENSPDRAFT_649930 [Peniophora sp. CONT]